MSIWKTLRHRPSGMVTLPPSKSLSHRAMICAYLASLCGGKSTIHHLGESQDIEATLRCIRAMGGNVQHSGQTMTFPPGNCCSVQEMYCHESGSTLRFLIPVAMLSDKVYRFTGSERLMERPLQAYADAFAQTGGTFQQQNGVVTVQGPLCAGEYVLPGNVSSQFISGLLFALPLVHGDSQIRLQSPLESKAYVDMTLDVMRQFGITIEEWAEGYRIPGGQRYSAAEYTVEADYSQAAFFLVAAALGCDVSCAGLHSDSLQGDRAILDILQQAGCSLHRQGDRIAVKTKTLAPITVDASEIPDLIPPVAVLCCFADGVSHIVNAGRLRYKESDRLHALALELTALGGIVEEGEDSLTITGQVQLNGGKVHTHNDHRIAMAMAVASLRCKQPVEIENPDCVCKSYPAFWQDFEQEAWR